MGDDAPASAERKDAVAELSRSDKRFFTKAARLNSEEMNLSRVASERAVDPGVRAFAAEMVRVHGAAADDISALARRKGVAWDTRDSAEARAETRKWNEKKADKFDGAYLDAIIDSHQDMVDVLENAAESKDAEISALAGKLLATTKAHLVRAEGLDDSMD